MSRFIEVTALNGKFTVNLDFIASIFKLSDTDRLKTRLSFSQHIYIPAREGSIKGVSIDVEESYEDIVLMLQ